MDCARFAQALIDHALGAPLEPRAAAHLSACAHCRARLETERRLLSSIDRELHATLAVEPAPEFAARLQSRLADAPRGASHGSPWWTSMAVAAAVLLAVAATMITRRDPAPEVVSAPVPVVAETAPRVASAPPSVPRSAPAISPTVRARPAAVRRRGPEVLVEPGQEDGLRRFLHQLNQGRVDSASLADSSEPAAPGVVALIESSIVPVTIEPLFPIPAGEKPGG